MTMGDYNPKNKEALDTLLLVIPGVKPSKSFGYPCYKVNGRIFAWVVEHGAAIKVGQKRAKELIESGVFKPFEVAEKMVWKDWVSLPLENPADYEQYLEVFEESIGFVAQG